MRYLVESGRWRPSARPVDAMGRIAAVPKLPRGRVTFVLSDMEGSTALVHQLGDEYGPLLNELRRLMRAAVQKAGGREVDAIGDELFAAFEQAPSAVYAAVAIQRAVRDHAWADGVAVRVRMGVHTGRPTLGETGYLGLAVHTVARVCASAHGGQIVISSAVREAVGPSLPDGVSLESLGSWRLNGLRESMELHQVRTDDLLHDFPPVRSVALAASR